MESLSCSWNQCVTTTASLSALMTHPGSSHLKFSKESINYYLNKATEFWLKMTTPCVTGEHFLTFTSDFATWLTVDQPDIDFCFCSPSVRVRRYISASLNWSVNSAHHCSENTNNHYRHTEQNTSLNQFEIWICSSWVHHINPWPGVGHTTCWKILKYICFCKHNWWFSIRKCLICLYFRMHVCSNKSGKC